MTIRVAPVLQGSFHDHTNTTTDRDCGERPAPDALRPADERSPQQGRMVLWTKRLESRPESPVNRRHDGDGSLSPDAVVAEMAIATPGNGLQQAQRHLLLLRDWPWGRTRSRLRPDPFAGSRHQRPGARRVQRLYRTPGD